jgi:subtilisin-like proprotein convertase family protein
MLLGRKVNLRVGATLLILIGLVGPLLLTSFAEGLKGVATPSAVPPAPTSCTVTTVPTASNNTPVAISATGTPTISSTITIAGAQTFLYDVDITASISHTSSGQIHATLTSPAGTVVTLTSNNGLAFDNIFFNTTWDDDADVDGTIPFATNASSTTDTNYSSDSQTGFPLTPEEPLAAFVGENPNGVWTLTVNDSTNGQGGSLNSWSLNLATLAAAPTTVALPVVTNTTPQPVPGASPNPETIISTINVPSGGTIFDVNVTTDISHTFSNDLQISLTSPEGTVITLSSNNGGSVDNAFVGTLWDDDANPGGLAGNSTNFGLVTDHPYILGNVTTLAPEEALGAFIGESPVGTWTLRVADTKASADTGSLNSWSLAITTASCGAQSCVVPGTITGTIGQGSPNYPSTSGTITERLSQDGVNSSCAAPKVAPSGPAASLAYDAYEFYNDTSATTCVTFQVSGGSCGVNRAIHPVAYLNSFNPADAQQNYLGDIGHSLNSGEQTDTFSVNVPAHSTVVLVVHDMGTLPTCASYSFSVTNVTACPPTPSPSPSPSPSPGVTLVDSSVVESDSGTTTMFFNVVLSAPSTSEVQVTVATVDGTAQSTNTGTPDYIPVSLAPVRLAFAPGQTQHSIGVTVNGDNAVEQDETFTLALSSPDGVSLVDPIATGMIINDDPGPSIVGQHSSAFHQSSPALNVNNRKQQSVLHNTGHALEDARFFVRQHYFDFLGREPDESGLQFWANEIESCGNNEECKEVRRVNVSAAFFLSIESQETRFLAHRLHRAAFGSLPGLNDFFHDSQELGEGVIVGQPGAMELLEANKARLLSDFVQRTNFRRVYDARSNAGFVDVLISNAGLRISQAERDSLVADLDTGSATRAAVLLRIVEHSQFKQLEFSRAFVLSQYFGYLRRDPQAAPDNNLSGYQFWLGKLNQFGGNFQKAEMVKAFLTSGEYRQRFGAH